MATRQGFRMNYLSPYMEYLVLKIVGGILVVSAAWMIYAGIKRLMG